MLAERLLRGVSADDVRRVPARRVAGVSAPGLRVEAAFELSSIDHADLWLDPESGVPLRVEVYAAGTGTAAFTSEFREFSSDRPDSASIGFDPPAGVDVEFDDVLDIADAANQYAPVRRPTPWPGCPRRRPRIARSASTDAG